MANNKLGENSTYFGQQLPDFEGSRVLRVVGENSSTPEKVRLGLQPSKVDFCPLSFCNELITLQEDKEPKYNATHRSRQREVRNAKKAEAFALRRVQGTGTQVPTCEGGIKELHLIPATLSATEGSLKVSKSILQHAARYRNRDDVQEIAWELISDLCTSSSEDQVIVVVSGAIAFTLEQLERTSMSNKHTLNCLRALCLMCESCDVGKLEAGSLGAIGIIIRVLKHDVHDIDMQILGMNALCALVADMPANMSKFITEEGVQFILSTLRKFRGQVSVQGATLSVLRRLCCESAEVRIIVGTFGGLRDISSAIKCGMDSVELVLDGCLCLRYLAFIEENRIKASESKCIQIVMEAAERLKHLPHVTETLLVVSNFTFDSEANKGAVTQNKGICTIVEIMDIHALAPDVVCSACRVLRNVSDSTGAIKRICYEHNALHAVAEAMKLHVGHAGIQEHGAAMLINMMSGYLEDIQQTVIEDYLDVICDLHSLCTEVFVQVNYLKSELQKMRTQHAISMAPKVIPGSQRNDKCEYPMDRHGVHPGNKSKSPLLSGHQNAGIPTSTIGELGLISSAAECNTALTMRNGDDIDY